MTYNSTFNPEEWQTSIVKPASQDYGQMAMSPVNPGDVASDVECVLRQIEEKHVDITFTYDRWVRTGFALAHQFGEDGRKYFQRASRFYSGYSQSETDKQYDYCLQSDGEGITIRTFFGYAQEAGADLRTLSYKSPISPKSPKSPQNVGGETGETGVSGDLKGEGLPTFSDLITPNLPGFLKTIASYGRNAKETDILLLAAITVISGCLPKLQGVYDGRIVYANLYFFLSARAGSGKGRIDLCRLIAVPIHRRLKDDYDKKRAQYELDMASWENNATSSNGAKPKHPTVSMLFIPADCSATAFNQSLNDNGGNGMLFETEADALADAFDSDFGDFSKSFRAAFHHEGIAYRRRAGNEYVDIENPKLSVVLSGTRDQVARLFRSVENGAFSRFMFYRLEADLEWRSVLANQDTETMDDKFNDLGEDFLAYYDLMCKQELIRFKVTKAQSDSFDEYFSQLMHDYVRIFNDEILGSVFRLGLICYRIAMVLTALRMKDTGEVSGEIICEDQDFNSALTICRVLAVHLTKIFDELTTRDYTRSAVVSKTTKRQLFFDNLPEEFDRQDYLKVASRQGVPEGTSEKWIKAFCAEDGPLEKVEHGRYRKRR